MPATGNRNLNPPSFGYNARMSSSAPPANNTTPAGPPRENFPSHTADGTVPMELNSGDGLWHLAVSEKRRRRELRLCAYCGKSGHQVHDCPSAPPSRQYPRNQQAFMAINVTDPSTSFAPTPSPSSEYSQELGNDSLQE